LIETPEDPDRTEEQPEASEPAGEPEAPVTPPADEPAAEEEAAPAEEPVAEEEPAAAEEPVAEEEPVADEEPASAEEPVAEEAPAPAEEPVAEEAPAPAEEPVAEEAPSPDAAEGDTPGAELAAADDEASGATEDDGEEPAPRVKPEIPGADLEPDIVLDGEDRFAGREKPEIPGADLEPDIVVEGEAEGDVPEGYATPGDGETSEDADEQPIAQAAIDLAAGARYTATGKRKSSIARVILKPGDGSYTINGRPLDVHFPRPSLQRNIRQPLETVGYETRMDVVATLQGGGVAGQAGALRHGISRALTEADPNLRTELKRRGFLTRDSRVKERKKAGLKKARKRPQFSKR
jgi:small subunit ribosomal protein S9